MRKTLPAIAVACALTASLGARAQAAQDPPTPAPPPDAADQADVQKLASELQTLKASYAQEVRRLRELDMQVQALQARLAGKAGGAPLPAMAGAPPPEAAAASGATTVAAASEGAAQASAATRPPEDGEQRRSLQDALQQEHALFSRKLTIENGINYAWYDRRQLTLNGFLALDAIFLGNIALQDVKSHTGTYTLTARYGVTPRLVLNVDVPYLARHTSYIQGGAGGAAATLQEESNSGSGLGDIALSANYKLFAENGRRPDTVLTFGLTAPTGREPYGIDWVVPGTNGQTSADDGRFAVPDKQPTGNGVWQASLGVSAVKTMDPAIIFANLGYIHSFAHSFGDIDTDPQTRTPGRVDLRDSYYFGAGVALAFNERTSLSLSFSDKFSQKAQLRAQGAPGWTRVIGSDANAATFNMGFTYAMSQHTTLVTMLGIGLTPDAANYSLTFKIPYIF
ncbi:transporter [Fulvimonas soli]|jgi:hypothetical protein|uniref:Outer membrane putative beta-barrel porin/alpha-amylase n=1 Tax=Fulvimonas soli TaxID=155197 RepID=A0A316I0K3_9GAMM|nr:transporter [Fulvimonas soli]PWK86621.1 outer membrane putative beta-barrel porin/alpha-amylase [Fulvimonas soli]